MMSASMEELCEDLFHLSIGAITKQRYRQSAVEYNKWWIKEAKRARCDDVKLEEKVRAVMIKTDDLLDLTNLQSTDYDILRFMTSPVISKDRLRTFAACDQLPAISDLLDDRLFPWLKTRSHPNNNEIDMAIHSLCCQMQNIKSATSLRTRHEAFQKEHLEKLLFSADYHKVPSMTATTPTVKTFTSKLDGIRLKPDMTICNTDGGLLLLELKACGDRTNSIKRMQEMSAKKEALLESLASTNRALKYMLVLFGHFVQQSVDAAHIDYVFQHELGGSSCPIQAFIIERVLPGESPTVSEQ